MKLSVEMTELERAVARMRVTYVNNLGKPQCGETEFDEGDLIEFFKPSIDAWITSEIVYCPIMEWYNSKKGEIVGLSTRLLEKRVQSASLKRRA